MPSRKRKYSEAFEPVVIQWHGIRFTQGLYPKSRCQYVKAIVENRIGALRKPPRIWDSWPPSKSDDKIFVPIGDSGKGKIYMLPNHYSGTFNDREIQKIEESLLLVKKSQMFKRAHAVDTVRALPVNLRKLSKQQIRCSKGNCTIDTFNKLSKRSNSDSHTFRVDVNKQNIILKISKEAKILQDLESETPKKLRNHLPRLMETKTQLGLHIAIYEIDGEDLFDFVSSRKICIATNHIYAFAKAAIPPINALHNHGIIHNNITWQHFLINIVPVSRGKGPFYLRICDLSLASKQYTYVKSGSVIYKSKQMLKEAEECGSGFFMSRSSNDFLQLSHALRILANGNGALNNLTNDPFLNQILLQEDEHIPDMFNIPQNISTLPSYFDYLLSKAKEFSLINEKLINLEKPIRPKAFKPDKTFHIMPIKIAEIDDRDFGWIVLIIQGRHLYVGIVGDEDEEENRYVAITDAIFPLNGLGYTVDQYKLRFWNKNEESERRFYELMNPVLNYLKRFDISITPKLFFKRWAHPSLLFGNKCMSGRKIFMFVKILIDHGILRTRRVEWDDFMNPEQNRKIRHVKSFFGFK